MIDWIASYMENVENYPVLSRAKPGEIRSKLPKDPPAQGESMEAMFNDVNEIIMPGITHWQSPNFFGFFPANNSGPAILGDLLSSGLCVQGMLWATSPACTELETHVLDWLADMLDLPSQFKSSSDGGGVIQDTASTGDNIFRRLKYCLLYRILPAGSKTSPTGEQALPCDRRSWEPPDPGCS